MSSFMLQFHPSHYPWLIRRNNTEWRIQVIGLRPPKHWIPRGGGAWMYAHLLCDVRMLYKWRPSDGPKRPASSESCLMSKGFAFLIGTFQSTWSVKTEEEKEEQKRNVNEKCSRFWSSLSWIFPYSFWFFLCLNILFGSSFWNTFNLANQLKIVVII